MTVISVEQNGLETQFFGRHQVFMSVVYENTFMRVDFTFQYRIFVERFVGFS